MEIEDTVRCNNCYWQGIEDELRSYVDLSDEVTKEIHYTAGCPECLTDEYLTDL